MTFSHGAKLLLKEIASFSPSNFLQVYPLLMAQAKSKGRKVVYPCDFKAIKIRFEAIHDSTNRKLFVYVKNGNIRQAIEDLAYLIKLEDSSNNRLTA